MSYDVPIKQVDWTLEELKCLLKAQKKEFQQSDRRPKRAGSHTPKKDRNR